MNNFEIGKAIRNKRKFLKLSQQDLSEIVGISLRSLIDIESGKGNPTISQLQKIFIALGLTINIK